MSSLYQQLGHGMWVALHDAVGDTIPEHMRDIPPARPRVKRDHKGAVEGMHRVAGASKKESE